MSAIDNARATQHRALEWLRTHPDTHSARKLDVKALIVTVDALIAEHERLATTTADDREALWDIIVILRDSYPRHPADADSEEIAEAILAAGFRRPIHTDGGQK